MELTKRRREMFGLAQAYGRGGLKREEFCSRHGLKVSTFSWWLSEYRREHGKSAATVEGPSFVSIAGSASVQAVEYRYADGCAVRIPSALGAGQVGSIIRELRGAACSG